MLYVAGYDMSPFIRRYAKYLSEKSGAYRGTAMDFCKVKRGKEGGALRTMSGDKLLKTMPILQNQVDALIEFDCSSTVGIMNIFYWSRVKERIISGFEQRSDQRVLHAALQRLDQIVCVLQ